MPCSTYTSPGSEKLGSPKRIRYNPVEVAIQQRKCQSNPRLRKMMVNMVVFLFNPGGVDWTVDSRRINGLKGH